MNRFTKSVVELAKGMAALAGAFLSVSIGLSLAFVSFALAVAIRHQLALLIPCILVAGLVPLFLVGIPRFIYRWRYGVNYRWQYGSPKIRRAH